jgi:hypothetical protein
MKTKLKIDGATVAELRKFIDSNVCFDGYGYDEPKDNTIQAASVQLFDEVVRHDRRLKTLSVKFTEALQGLPSYIDIPFMNYDIANLMYSLGLDFDRNDDDDYFQAVDIYWAECGRYLADVITNI